MEYMKISNPTTFDRIKIRTACIFTITILSIFVFFTLNLPWRYLFLFFTSSNYFWFNGKVIALACTSPMFIYVILYSFLALFSKNNEPPKSFQKYATIIAILFFSLFILLNIISLIIYLYIAIFTTYEPCQDSTLKNYYVTDYNICRHLEKRLFY